jgi:UDP-glucose 4-epimerase
MVMTITRALVTGASGFIGTALCRRLIESGVEVHAVSRNPPAGAGARHWWQAADISEAALATKIHWWKADMVEL